MFVLLFFAYCHIGYRLYNLYFSFSLGVLNSITMNLYLSQQTSINIINIFDKNMPIGNNTLYKKN